MEDISAGICNRQPYGILIKNLEYCNDLLHYFKVSYKAMLKQLIQLRLCDEKLYEPLLDFQSLERVEELEKITQLVGYTTELIKPSGVRSISTEYIEVIRRNFEENKISYGKLEEMLEFIGKLLKTMDM